MKKSINSSNSVTRQAPLLCIAHRGGRQLGTENTLGTIEKALSLGVDAVEIDVWCVNKQLIVTHDRELGRVVTGNGRITDLTNDEVKNLVHHDGSSVAKLVQVLELVSDRTRLNIELKGPGCAPEVANCLENFCGEKNIDLNNYIVSSFDHQQLHWLLNNKPKILRGVLHYGHAFDGLGSCIALKAYSYHPSVDFIDPDLIAEARRRGMEVWAYTVNRTDDFTELQALGVTGVFTDTPELLKEFNRNLSEK